MRRFVAGIGVAVALCTLALGSLRADDKAIAKEKATLKGTWRITSILKDGKEIDAFVNLGIDFVFDGDRLEIRGEAEGFETQVKQYRIDPTVTPKILDFADNAKAIENADKLFEGIYEIKDDTMRWCVKMSGDNPAKGDRPTMIESTADNSALVITLKRRP
ncbi:TIGR03067 domain-containing protein [Tuwongella immobilis]|uniref:TIGR03067 domain-containing protein n=1 Tax=Tuwongella immobilis TaxID=692036 RepID=A0A6C2YNH7_9BACT|nr:TIGR03067 domain-containing protein [Tuwongella immobilis]VIP02927.1 Uncharacterized protein OS=Planctomyces maris DSM 8797 GN=PM8797T_25221 PE=4 SV=1 [Tuwongella immobilis]VTS02869.1 Uncharacterized protein OS=Planctomyces maris DSM 8797 GN=PM8797T_25221 PE=4 SV=1 [Tuwongella immobilis]